MKDLFLITGSLGVCLGLAVLAIALIDHAKRRTAVRDRLADMPDADPAVADALELLWAMPAYGTDDHTTNPTGD